MQLPAGVKTIRIEFSKITYMTKKREREREMERERDRERERERERGVPLFL